MRTPKSAGSTHFNGVKKDELQHCRPDTSPTFGEEFAESGTQEKHHFTSYERDSEAGTDYAVNRQYSQVVGRFMRVDPYGGSVDEADPQSWNRYSYVLGDPVNTTDPQGLVACTIDFHIEAFFHDPLWGAGHYRRTQYGDEVGPAEPNRFWFGNVFEIFIKWDYERQDGLPWGYYVLMWRTWDFWWESDRAGAYREKGWEAWVNVSPATLGQHYWAPRSNLLYLYMYADLRHRYNEVKWKNGVKVKKTKWHIERGTATWDFYVAGTTPDGTVILCDRTLRLTAGITHGDPVWSIQIR